MTRAGGRSAMALCVALTMWAGLFSPAWGAQTVAGRIAAMPAGANIELRLKNAQRMRGTRGAVSPGSFVLADSAGEHQILFGDVASVRRVGQSHVLRNVLIVSAVGVAALGITIGILLRCGSLGCSGKI